MNLKLKAKIIENYGTQADFAQMLDIDEFLVSRVVRGRRELKPADKQKWARILKADVEELFKTDARN